MRCRTKEIKPQQYKLRLLLYCYLKEIAVVFLNVKQKLIGNERRVTFP